MKPVKKALLFSVIWIVLMIAGGIVHTNVLRAGELTSEQDSALSARYGNACFIGLVLIWIFVFTQKQPKR